MVKLKSNNAFKCVGETSHHLIGHIYRDRDLV